MSRTRGLLVAALLLVPSLLAAAQNTLTWQDNASDEDAVHVERAVNGTGWNSIVTLPPDTETSTETAVEADSTYCYRVYASNETGDSEFSNVACRTVPPSTDWRCATKPSGWAGGYWRQWVRRHC